MRTDGRAAGHDEAFRRFSHTYIEISSLGFFVQPNVTLIAGHEGEYRAARCT